MNSATYQTDLMGGGPSGAAKIIHSTSVNALNAAQAVPQGVASEQDRVGLQAQPNTMFRQFHHGSSSHHHTSHSQSTLAAVQKLNFNGTNGQTKGGIRPSATNGIKLTPSQQHGAKAPAIRDESPSSHPTAPNAPSSSSQGSTILLAHHQSNFSQNAAQAKRHPSSKIGGVNNTSNSGRLSSAMLGTTSGNPRTKAPSGSFTGVQAGTLSGHAHSSAQMLGGKEKSHKSSSGGQQPTLLKQAKSIENIPSGTSQKPPSSSKPQSTQQLTRGSATLDLAVVTGHQNFLPNPSSALLKHEGGGNQLKNQSHTRTQASLGLKQHHLSSNLLNTNSRSHLKAVDGQLKVISTSSIGQKRSSETTDLEKRGAFSKHTRLSQQVSSSTSGPGSTTASATGSNNRLITQKTSQTTDFRKPGQLASHHPMAIQQHKNHHHGQQQNSSNQALYPANPAATSQIVSQHSYQQTQVAQSNSAQVSIQTISMTSGPQLQTPTATSLKGGHKPPLDSNKQHGGLSAGGHPTANTVSVTSSYQHKRHSYARSSPRNQLNVFTKKSSQDIGSSKAVGGMTISDPKSNFNQTSTSLKTTSAFSPQDDSNSAKRLSGEIARSTIFPHSSKSSTSQMNSRATVSIKNQLNQHQHNKKLSNTNLHAPHGSSNTKSRNMSSKASVSGSGNHLVRETSTRLTGSSGATLHRHQSQSNPNLELGQSSSLNDAQQKEGATALDYASRTRDKNSTSAVKQQQHQQYPLTTKHSASGAAVGGLAGRSSSVNMKMQKEQPSGGHQDEGSIGQQATAKLNGGVPSILNSYKLRSASPPDPTMSKMMNKSNGMGHSIQHGVKQTPPAESSISHNHSRKQASGATQGSFISQMSYKMAQNRVPQIMSSKQSSSTAGNSTKDSSDIHNPGRQQTHQKGVTEHLSHKLSNAGPGHSVANQIAQRKVRSATRASDLDQHPNISGDKGSGPGAHLGSGSNAFLQQKLSQQKFTDRPSSASAGQKFIGRQQNLKELFERNWQSVNVQNKVDPQSGEATQIRSLTVVDTNSMVHEDQQEAAALPLAPGTRIIIPNHEPTKCSNKRNGIVRAYAANTNQGLVRNYNEDRVSIILNIVKPEHRKHEMWPTCSFFGVYDGHGGSACAEFLRDNLHHFVIKEESFPWQPEEAIRRGFEKAEARFLEMCQAKDDLTGKMSVIERSGSCAIVVLIVGEICYVANVGDSRAVLSSGGGQQMTALSRDHKPSDIEEYKRIIKAGGQIYQTTTSQVLNQKDQIAQQIKDGKPADPEFIVGPIRVLPGRLSVCRTFGDPEAKLEYRNGNPNVVKAQPDIKTFQISKSHDFIVLASDGIFDKLTDDDIGKAVWLTCEAAKQAKNQANAGSSSPLKNQQANSISVHQYCGLGVEGILKNSLMRQSLDNVTVVMVAFQNFKRVVCGQSSSRSTIDIPATQKHSAGKLKESASTHENQISSIHNNETSSRLDQAAQIQEDNHKSLNNKKISGVRSHQTLATRNANTAATQNDRVSDRQLTRQAGKIADHTPPRQGKHEIADSNSLFQNNNLGNLPRTRSLNQDQMIEHKPLAVSQGQQSSNPNDSGYSIRYQQQQHQATKLQQAANFQKPRASFDHIQQARSSAQLQSHHGASNAGSFAAADNIRQQAKPPTASGAQVKSSKAHYNQREPASSQMRSLSLKEVRITS